MKLLKTKTASVRKLGKSALGRSAKSVKSFSTKKLAKQSKNVNESLDTPPETVEDRYNPGDVKDENVAANTQDLLGRPDSPAAVSVMSVSSKGSSKSDVSLMSLSMGTERYDNMSVITEIYDNMSVEIYENKGIRVADTQQMLGTPIEKETVLEEVDEDVALEEVDEEVALEEVDEEVAQEEVVAAEDPSTTSLVIELEEMRKADTKRHKEAMEAVAKLEAEVKAMREADEKRRIEAEEAQANVEAELKKHKLEQERLAAEKSAEAERKEQERRAAEEAAKRKAEATAKLEADAKARKAEEEAVKLAAQKAKMKLEAEAEGLLAQAKMAAHGRRLLEAEERENELELRIQKSTSIEEETEKREARMQARVKAAIAAEDAMQSRVADLRVRFDAANKAEALALKREASVRARIKLAAETVTFIENAQLNRDEEDYEQSIELVRKNKRVAIGFFENPAPKVPEEEEEEEEGAMAQTFAAMEDFFSCYACGFGGMEDQKDDGSP